MTPDCAKKIVASSRCLIALLNGQALIIIYSMIATFHAWFRRFTAVTSVSYLKCATAEFQHPITFPWNNKRNPDEWPDIISFADTQRWKQQGHQIQSHKSLPTSHQSLFFPSECRNMADDDLSLQALALLPSMLPLLQLVQLNTLCRWGTGCCLCDMLVVTFDPGHGTFFGIWWMLMAIPMLICY